MKEVLLKHWLWSARTKETAYNKVKNQWNKNNKFIWQCAVTALLIQEILGWEIIRADVKNYWFSHYWNKIEWKEMDFTFWQFSSWENPILVNKEIYNKQDMLNNKDTCTRLKKLRSNFFAFIEEYEKIEKNISICKKCENADHFNHRSVYLWNNCSLLFVWEAPAKNGWRVTWKAWINEKGNIIPSWVVLQKLLNILWIDLSEITFTESIKCFPEERKYIKEMVKNCSHILYSQINTLKPNVIITLWDAPTKSLIENVYNKFSEVVGKEYKINILWKEYVVLPTYHPSPISPLSYKANIPIYELLNDKYNIKF